MSGTKLYKSTCPECGNIDMLREHETKRIVHCQRCYKHYDYKQEGTYFRGFKTRAYFNN